jgi:predicted dienelactone hydrolase
VRGVEPRRQETTGRQAYKPGPGSYAVETTIFDWTDNSRQRPVPVKIYSPQGAGQFPVIVFSHGLGGSRDGYEYLGRYWASHGYVSVHVQHLGSDSAVWQGTLHPLKSMRAAAMNPTNAIARPLDIRFVIDRLEALARDGSSPFKGRLDLGAIGVAGHSFGAWTALAVAGQSVGLVTSEPTLADPRVKAAIAMSPAPPLRKRQLDEVYGRIKIPVFHMTGTRDDSPISNTRAAERRVPFNHISGPDQYLLVFDGGDHMVFAGTRRPAKAGYKDEIFQNLIEEGSTAFWDAYLRKDAAAKAWLASGGFQAALGRNGKLEKKIK